MSSDIFGSSSFGFVLGCVCMCPRVQSILPCVLSEPVKNVRTIAVMGNYCGPRGPDSTQFFPPSPMCGLGMGSSREKERLGSIMQ